MSTAATRMDQDTRTLYVAFELGEKEWKLAMSPGLETRPRLRSLPARGTKRPDNALTHWYNERFARGGPRARKVGIVALARKLLVALWRYVETGALPEGAVLKA